MAQRRFEMGPVGFLLGDISILSKPVLKKRDYDVADGTALQGASSFDFAIKLIRDAKSGFHSYSFLYYWLAVKKAEPSPSCYIAAEHRWPRTC